MKKETIDFVIPLKPKIKSGNWSDDCKVLNKTLQSLINQISPHFRAYVIYSDMPDFILEDKRIQYIHFPYGFQEFKDIPQKEILLKDCKTENMVVRRWDKGRKVTYGSKIAIENNCHYIMSLDADDLVSNKLVEFIENNHRNYKVPGWIIDKGYVYKENSRYLVRVPRKMNYLNGSTIILHTNLIKIPDFSSAKYLDYNLFTDHGWAYDRMKIEYGVELELVKFPAVVYVVHGNNASFINRSEFGFTIKNVIKRILRGVFITSRIKNEFSLTILLIYFHFTMNELFLF